MWTIETTDEFNKWFLSLADNEQDEIRTSIRLLERLGPHLPRPHADTLKNSKHSNMKELRTQIKGRPFRSLFAFDPNRSAILLIGGDKTGDKRFYKKIIPIADDIFDKYLESME